MADPPGNHAHSLLRQPNRRAGIGALVHEGEFVAAHLRERAQAKAEQNALLDPGVDPPSEGGVGIGLGGPHSSALRALRSSRKASMRCAVADGIGAGGKMALDVCL